MMMQNDDKMRDGFLFAKNVAHETVRCTLVYIPLHQHRYSAHPHSKKEVFKRCIARISDLVYSRLTRFRPTYTFRRKVLRKESVVKGVLEPLTKGVTKELKEGVKLV